MQDQMATLVTNAYMEGRKVGRKEVVEWITNHGGSLDGVRTEWQAQLKEWGLEDV